MAKDTPQPAAVASPAPSAAPMARVRDTLCKTGKPRVHDVAGRSWTFTRDEYVTMPLEVARKLAHIPEFEVLGPNGARIVANPTLAVVSSATPLALRSDQCIAQLHELTDAAIDNRLLMLGDEVALTIDDRESKIAFLMQAAADEAERAQKEAARLRPRKVLVNGVLREVTPGQKRRSREAVMDDDGGEEGAISDETAIVEPVNMAALYMAQQAARAAG